MHRWVLAAEPGYGIALANDSSYGYDAAPWTAPGADAATGTLLRPSLMRSPNWPDPRADLSRRTVRYSLVADADPASAAQAGDASICRSDSSPATRQHGSFTSTILPSASTRSCPLTMEVAT